MKKPFILLAIFVGAIFSNASANSCIDTGVLGDGWGWDGEKSCRIDIEPGLCIDYDGDGWGWDGVRSCTDVVQISANNGAVFPVLPTGQVTSYIDGDDGDWQTSSQSVSRFTDNNNGTFSDTLTGLTWLGIRECILELDWFDAINYVNQLSAGQTNVGQTSVEDSVCIELSDDSSSGDWRLPNITELQSLLDYSQIGPAFAEGIPFTGTWDTFPWGRYWSSTSFSADASNTAWVVDAVYGQTNPHIKSENSRVFAVKDQ